MAQQVQRIGGQLLEANLLRELADLQFDTDLLVIKRDGTLGINTLTTPRLLTIDGTLKANSGTSDPDIIFGNSITVGDLTISTQGASVPSGTITIESTHPEGFISASGFGSTTQAIRNGGIEALQTNGDVSFRSAWLAGMTEAWNNLGNYGNYWYPGPRDSAEAPENDGDRLYQEAVAVAQAGNPTADELAAFDFDGDGTVDVTDALKILTLNTQFINGTAFPASRVLGDHYNPEGLKSYIEMHYPRSAPRKLQLQTGGTLTVTGNLHATGNITYGGSNLTIGDDSTDSAEFLAEFTTDLIPDLHDAYYLGKDDDSTGPKKGWITHINTLNTDRINGKNLVYQNIFLTRSSGVIYVSKNNGNDSNRGTHPAGPFATVTKALSIAQAGDLIYIYPGVYQEDFPMTVPNGVTVVGDNIRQVEIIPTTETQSNDAFLVDGDTGIENLTIKDFYFNSSANTGYGFRFKPDFRTLARSPYVRNCSVITKGTNTTESDPRGFASGDAGKGALVDAGEINPTSLESSMLFHGVTFITPGVDALTMTNGVRVEWLNSFTYFANRGLYATQGVQGRLLSDSTRKFGAEIRSIGSANVYGNFGAVADGADTLMYLINHNFAYIGAGGDANNDESLVNDNARVQKFNGGQIYHQSQDHKGNFTIGDTFKIDVEKGNTSFDINTIFSNNSVIKIRGPNTETIINAQRLQTSDIVLLQDKITTTRSSLDLGSITGTVNILSDANIPNLDLDGNLTVDGSIIGIGNDPADTVDFNTPFDQDILPNADDAYNLGSSEKIWRTGYFSNSATVNEVNFTGNTISTNDTNANLEIISGVPGDVYFEDVAVSNNKVKSRYSPAGEYKVNDSLETNPNIFSTYENLKYTLRKHIDVFGIPVLAAPGVTDDYVLHVANILSGFIDNNYDGIADDANVMTQFADGLTGIVIYLDNNQKTNLAGTFGNFVDRTVSITSDNINLGGDANNNLRDYTLQVCLQELLIEKGYTVAYADLDYNRPTILTNAMDTARGGFQAGGLPGYNYPPFAWYTEQSGLDYQNLTYFYLYLLVSAYAGSLSWRAGELSPDWQLATQQQLLDTDDAGVALLENPTWTLPLSEPVLDYWTAVTNNVGPTVRDLILQPLENLSINGTNNLGLPVGQGNQRPSVTGGLRYNSTFGILEGVVGGGAVSLEGIYDTDRDTYLDLSNNEYTFYTGGVPTHTLNGTLLESTALSSNNKFKIDGNTVGTTSNGQAIQLKSNGTRKTIQVYTGTQVTTAQKKHGQRSLRLNGTSDFLTRNTNTRFGLGASNFTIEGYFRFDSFAADNGLLDLRENGSDANGLYIRIVNNNDIRVTVNGVDVLRHTSITFSTDTWYHIAVVKSDNVTRLYVDGVQVGNIENNYADTNNYGSTKPIALGSYWDKSNKMTGYVDGFRISSSARYLVNFNGDLPGALTDDVFTKYFSNFDTQESLLPWNKEMPTTLHGGTKRLGNAAAQFDGSDDYIAVDTHEDFGFGLSGGTGDFTVETYVYLSSLSGNRQIFDFRAGAFADIAPTVYISNGGQIRYYTASADRITGSTLLTGQWYHVALIRSGTSTKLYVDGTQVGSTYTDTNDYGSTKPLTIGSRFDGGNNLLGFLDDFRVSNIARHTTDFTPPQGQVTNGRNYVLYLPFNQYTGEIDSIVDESIGRTNIENLSFAQSVLYNNADSNFTFDLPNSSGFGYLKIDNVGGMRIPTGTDLQRRSVPERGELRYNVEQNYVEVYNGSSWINSAGNVESILEADVDELGFIYNLMLD